jgi:hypothetical protein
MSTIFPATIFVWNEGSVSLSKGAIVRSRLDIVLM